MGMVILVAIVLFCFLFSRYGPVFLFPVRVIGTRAPTMKRI
jgi:hypothetical protein